MPSLTNLLRPDPGRGEPDLDLQADFETAADLHEPGVADLERDFEAGARGEGERGGRSDGGASPTERRSRDRLNHGRGRSPGSSKSNEQKRENDPDPER
jgi:hypothetical protein